MIGYLKFGKCWFCGKLIFPWHKWVTTYSIENKEYGLAHFKCCSINFRKRNRDDILE